MKKTIKGKTYVAREVEAGADCTGCAADKDYKLCREFSKKGQECFIENDEDRPIIWEEHE